MTEHIPEITIFSSALDLSTDAVVRRLAALGSHVRRVNTEDFPFDQDLTWSFPEGCHVPVVTGSGASLAQGSVWLRRLRSPARPPDMASNIYEYCRSEAYYALLGVLGSISPRYMMSSPGSIWTAENKPYQLTRAREFGLDIPRTVISNAPSEIRTAFAQFRGKMICKPVRSGHVVDEKDNAWAIYTSQVLDEHLVELDSAARLPCIYQELLPKQCDIRITWVDGECFVAEIDSQGDEDAKIDWRATNNPNLPHREGDFPEELLSRLTRLLRALDLRFAAVDFVRTIDGRYVFLEVNPSGQWLWLDDKIGFDITGAIARKLANGATRHE